MNINGKIEFDREQKLFNEITPNYVLEWQKLPINYSFGILNLKVLVNRIETTYMHITNCNAKQSEWLREQKVFISICAWDDKFRSIEFETALPVEQNDRKEEHVVSWLALNKV